MKKNKKRPSVTKALMWRITALALALWLCMMCCITWVCAGYVYDDYRFQFMDNVDAIDEFFHYEYIVNSEKERLQHDVFTLSSRFYANGPFPFMNLDGHDETDEYAIVCFDKRDDEGNWVTPCFVEDSNIMYFYFDAPEAETYTYGDGGYAYIDLDETQFGRDIVAESKRQYTIGIHDEDRHDDGYRFDRLTGWFDGNQFHLVEVADYPDESYDRWDFLREQPEPEEEWITVVDTAEPGKELVHIYPQYVNIRRGSTKPVTVDGVTYDNLGDMLESDVVYDSSENTLFKAVFQSSVYFTDSDGGEYLISIAAQASPLKVAFMGLLVFYVVTLLILAVVLLLIYRSIRKKLVAPMKLLLKWSAEGSLYMPEPEEYWWEEAYELYVQPFNAIHEMRKEINQLNTALEYAQNAEENRKRMISNITHELKTPLAVIHSYAEGLQEGIAGENQDRYLEVIMEESDRMDGMVLEMLDLSRLEAGKVRLSSDRFSLLELVKSVFEKLHFLVEQKKLEIIYPFPQDFQITADEGRIAQVITNLATNAIKYSPEEGKIWVEAYQFKGRTHFTIENQCDPLSQEALEKVWDSFYRTDASRTEKGTGLGLTITKAIVELHGGTCTAQNTSNGVKFMFELP